MSNDEWGTPPKLVDRFRREYGCAIDVCATQENAKLSRFYTQEVNGLLQPWDRPVWCNPPYSNITPWVQRAAQRKQTCVFLVPLSTSEKWWREWVQPFADIVYLPKRIKFVGADCVFNKPQAIVIYPGPRVRVEPFFTLLDLTPEERGLRT